MNETVMFSICIPAYKSGHLEECIASIVAQTIPQFELIILNDCSPEPVRQIVDRFSDNRIRYYENQVNVGAIQLVDNWNKCLSLATGKYVMIMGDDDLLEPDYLQEFSDLMTKYPGVDVYHCRSQIVDEEGTTRMLTPACPAFEDVYDAIWHRLSQYRSNYISDFVYKAKELRERGGFYFLPLAWGSDDITAFIATGASGIAHSHRPVFKYRSHGLSISSTSSNGLDKLEADVQYAHWLRAFLQREPAGAESQVVYRHLVDNQHKYMRKRKVFTMAKLMQSHPFSNAWVWYRNRRRLELSLTDILTAMVKSLRMKGTL